MDRALLKGESAEGTENGLHLAVPTACMWISYRGQSFIRAWTSRRRVAGGRSAPPPTRDRAFPRQNMSNIHYQYGVVAVLPVELSIVQYAAASREYPGSPHERHGAISNRPTAVPEPDHGAVGCIGKCSVAAPCGSSAGVFAPSRPGLAVRKLDSGESPYAGGRTRYQLSEFAFISHRGRSLWRSGSELVKRPLDVLI